MELWAGWLVGQPWLADWLAGRLCRLVVTCAFLLSVCAPARLSSVCPPTLQASAEASAGPSTADVEMEDSEEAAQEKQVSSVGDSRVLLVFQ